MQSVPQNLPRTVQQRLFGNRTIQQGDLLGMDNSATGCFGDRKFEISVLPGRFGEKQLCD